MVPFLRWQEINDSHSLLNLRRVLGMVREKKKRFSLCRRIDLRVLVNLAFLQLSPLKCANSVFALLFLPWVQSLEAVLLSLHSVKPNLVSSAGSEVPESRVGSAFSALFSSYGEFT